MRQDTSKNEKGDFGLGAGRLAGRGRSKRREATDNIIEGVSAGNKRFNAACDRYKRDLDFVTVDLDRREKALAERLANLDVRKRDVTWANVIEDASGDDLVERWGRVIAARRATLTHVMGSRFKALFSGQWDKWLQRDGSGHIFLDVNRGNRGLSQQNGNLVQGQSSQPPG
ncbi:LOW QUALITY PROTEIN: hypothetical protein ACHAWF_002831 [Thalassiosira exigua]